MQKLSTVHFSSWRDASRPDMDLVLQPPKRGDKAASRSFGLDGLTSHLPSHGGADENRASRENRADRVASRPRSWLTSMKHQRAESPAVMQRDGAAAAAAATPAPAPAPAEAPLVDSRGGRQSLEQTAFRIPGGGYCALPSTDRLTRDREWVDSVRVLIKETEEAFQAVRDVLEFNAKDVAMSKTRKTGTTGTPRPAEYTHSESVRRASCASKSSTGTHPSGACLAVLERAPSPLDKPLPPHPDRNGTGTPNRGEEEKERKRREREKAKEQEIEKELEKVKAKAKARARAKDIEIEGERQKQKQTQKQQRRQLPQTRQVKHTRKETPTHKASSMLKGLSKIKPPSNWIDHILTTARLKRIEADEMITREQIRQFCEGRRLRAQHLEFALQVEEGRQSSSSDSAGSEASGTSRASGSTALSSDHMSLCSASAVVMDPMDHAVVHRDFSVPQPQPGLEGREGGLLLEKQQQQQQQQYQTQENQSAEYPDPPPRNPERSNKRSHRLPTIPEAECDSVEGRGEDEQLARSSSHDNTHTRGLHSSRTSVVTIPSAAAAQRNGPVRHTTGSADRPSTSHGPGRQHAMAAAWPAENTHDANVAVFDPEDEDDDTADDMVNWFQTFGFESHGQLIHHEDDYNAASNGRAGSSSHTQSASAGVDEVDVRGNPAPATGHVPTGRPNPSFDAPIRFLTTQGPPRLWTPAGQPPVLDNAHESARWYRVGGARTTRV
ncbi:hypothetical protein E4U55_003819 [Claviceps digitariae]|nr:hypothetical protein E4U55_003819 [Claviceps digitariae]